MRRCVLRGLAPSRRRGQIRGSWIRHVFPPPSHSQPAELRTGLLQRNPDPPTRPQGPLFLERAKDPVLGIPAAAISLVSDDGRRPLPPRPDLPTRPKPTGS